MSDEWIQVGRRTLAAEAAVLAAVSEDLGAAFVQAVSLMLACRGKVVCAGVGKSGHIARKAAATLASTGTPAFYMHPTEAGHGDVGVLSPDDILLALSHSGESSEILDLLPAVRRRQTPLISISGNLSSSLAAASTVALLVRVEKEACPLNLAPMASSTAALALTDALSSTLMSARGFSSEDFARSHPLGRLGRRLLLRIEDVMRRGDNLPIVSADTAFTDALVIMTSKRMGMVLIVDGGQICGIFTDGDLRRAVASGGDFAKTVIGDLMTADPQTASPQALASEAIDLMRQKKLNHLVVAEEGKLLGALSFHDLLAHGLL